MNVLGLEDRYEVFEDGTVWSKQRKANNQYSERKQLKPSKGKHGYLEVRLYDGSKYHIWLVHRLVATHFIENTYNKRTVNHIDGNKENNNVSNLEWNTDSENKKHAVKLGISTVDLEQISRMNKSRRKFTLEQINNFRKEYSETTISLRKLAERENVSYSAMRDIIKRKNYVS